MKNFRKNILKSRAVIEKFDVVPEFLTRIGLGLMFFNTGLGKINNLAKVTKFFESLGIPGAKFQAPFVATLEMTCGVALVLGLGTRIVAIPLTVIMLVAIRTAHWDNVDGPLSLISINEYLYIIMLLWLIVRGSGKLSLDHGLRSYFKLG